MLTFDHSAPPVHHIANCVDEAWSGQGRSLFALHKIRIWSPSLLRRFKYAASVIMLGCRCIGVFVQNVLKFIRSIVFFQQENVLTNES